MARRDERIKMARPGEPEVVKTTIVGGQPPRKGRSVGNVPRGVEVLIKKAAVDPAFKKQLLEKRARAADAIALTLSPAEKAMLEAVPEAQLRAIVANTKVSPGLRPAFLGCAGGVMLTAVGAAAYGDESNIWENVTLDISPDTAQRNGTAAVAGENADSKYGWISGSVTDENGEPIWGAVIQIGISKLTAMTDKNGYYTIGFVVVPGAEYSITVSHCDYETKTEKGVKVGPGNETSLSFTLVSNKEEHEYVPSKYPLITGIMPDHPSKKGG